MPKLSILEYADVGSSPRGALSLPLEPPVSEQTIEIGFKSQQSAPLSPRTCIVRLVSDTDCRIAISAAADATDSLRQLTAGQEQLVTVAAGSGMRIAVVGTGSGVPSGVDS